MTEFQEQQMAIEKELCDALIEATPENWKQIELSVERVSQGLIVKIDTPGVNGFDIGPTPRLTRSIQKLFDLYRRGGSILESALYTLREEPDGGWIYKGVFQHATQP